MSVMEKIVTTARIVELWVKIKSCFVRTVNNKTVDENGNIDLNASDVGAVEADIEEAEDAGDVVRTNADLLGGMTLEQLDIYFEKLRLEREHPVGGQPYITFLPVEQDDPNVKWPWTSWTLDNEASGRFLLGANGTYPAGSTGGEANHVITIEEMPWHAHAYIDSSKYGIAVGSATAPVWGDEYGTTGATTGGAGGNQPHNNMPPYLAVYMWKRTA